MEFQCFCHNPHRNTTLQFTIFSPSLNIRSRSQQQLGSRYRLLRSKRCTTKTAETSSPIHYVRSQFGFPPPSINKANYQKCEEHTFQVHDSRSGSYLHISNPKRSTTRRARVTIPQFRMSSSIPHAIKRVPPEPLSSITATTIPHSKSNIETLPETPLPDYYNLPCQKSHTRTAQNYHLPLPRHYHLLRKATQKHHLRSLYRHPLNRKSNARTAQNHRLPLPRYHYSTQKKNTESLPDISSPIPILVNQKTAPSNPWRGPPTTILQQPPATILPETSSSHHPIQEEHRRESARNIILSCQCRSSKRPRSGICERQHPLMPMLLIQEDYRWKSARNIIHSSSSHHPPHNFAQ